MATDEEFILSSPETVARFWSKIEVMDNDPDACWDWLIRKDKGGYGIFWMTTGDCPTRKRNHSAFRAHRLMWILENDKPIPDGLLVIHSCDNPSCMNPRHLSLGNHKDNAKDMVQRGRHVPIQGEKHPNRKLNDDKVRNICKLYFLKGQSMFSLAKKYNVNPHTIEDIVKGRSWKHITKTHIPKGYLHKEEYNKVRNRKMYDRYLEGATYQEIADEFGVKYNWANSIIRRMRQHDQNH